LALKFGLVEPLQQFVASQKIVWGTCAGMIFLAKEVGATGSGGHVVPLRLGMMDIVVNRNAFGRQIDSFEADLRLTFDRDVPFRAIFIRAPSIESCGPEVEILAELANGTPVAARQGNLLVSAFHPELTNDLRLHRYFLRMVQANKEVDHERQ
jgi:5'-phosphate synthase pdxT subunit